MPQNARRRVLLAKLENTYGVDTNPTAADVVACRDISFDPDFDIIERPVIRPYPGAFDQIVAGKRGKLSVTLDYAAYGTAGPAAPIAGLDALLQSCGLARVITAGSDISYNPAADSNTHKSSTLSFLYDGIQHKITGARANAKVDAKRGGLTTVTLDIMGIYAGTTDVALPTVDLSPFQPPLPFRIGNDTFPALLGKAAGLCVEAFSFDMGNVMTYFDRTDCTEAVIITDRMSKAQVTMEATKVATMDALGKVIGMTNEALQWTHGTTAGNIIKLLAPRVQPTDVSYSEDNNIRMQTMDLMLKPVTGSDDFVWKFQ